MDNSLKGLLLAAGVIITCIVVALGFYISREANAAATTGVGQISRMNKEISESDKSMYDGMEVTGSEVINCINKNKNETLAIEVKTNKSTTQYNQKISGASEGSYTLDGPSGAPIKNAQDITDQQYINQNSQFSGEVLRDSNDAIVGIRFTQVKNK